MEFLDGGLLKHNHRCSWEGVHLLGTLKKRINSQVYEEKHSKMWISSQVFFKDFVDRFGTT